MKTTSPTTILNARLERELKRERQERHQLDAEKTGEALDDDLRSKDARHNSHAVDLPRAR